MKNLQKTLKRTINFSGIGLHSGTKANVSIKPHEQNMGIVFVRTDLKENNVILANYQNVSASTLCTTISNSNRNSVSTVEHLLAALYITGVDNALIEINNIEVPIMDGSSLDFVELINKVGTEEQKSERKVLSVNQKHELKIDNKFISIEPNNEGLVVDFKLNYKNPTIGSQRNIIDFSKDDLKDVYSSRTFCLYEDIEKIKKLGFAKGGSLKNAVVVQDYKVLNEGGLRNKLEFVNHKILDLAGDFLLSGFRINGKITSIEGGHNLSINFLSKMFNEISIERENLIDRVKNTKTVIQKLPNQIAVNS